MRLLYIKRDRFLIFILFFWSSMKTQVSAGIIVFRINQGKREYLLLHYIGGHWDLAKGKIEGNESKQEAAARELLEETSLTAKIIDGFEHSLSYHFRHQGMLIEKTVHFFVGELTSGRVRLSDEHIGFAWLSYEDSLKKLTFENAREMIKKAELFLNAR